MKKYIALMIAIALITMLTGCTREELGACEAQYSRIVGLTNLIQDFTNNWSILQLWPISWGITIFGKLKR
jgi:hypothetical protein